MKPLEKKGPRNHRCIDDSSSRIIRAFHLIYSPVEPNTRPNAPSLDKKSA